MPTRLIPGERATYRDNLKRFGPKTAGLCGVLKDAIRQGTGWRGHPERDVGSPGVAISEADAPFAPPFGGHHDLKLSQDGCDLDHAFMDEFGIDEVPGEVFDVLLEVSSTCNVRRVLLGLDDPPAPVSVDG